MSCLRLPLEQPIPADPITHPSRLMRQAFLEWVKSVTDILNRQRLTVTTDDSNARTITCSDENSLILFTSSSAVSVTLPADSESEIGIGFSAYVTQEGSGTVTVAGSPGVTVNAPLSLSTLEQYSTFRVIKTGSDEWKVIGDEVGEGGAPPTPLRLTVTTDSSTSRTLDADDEASIILFTNSSPVTVTLPLNASESIPIGFAAILSQEGSGAVTVEGAVGVTVNSAQDLSTTEQYATLTAIKVGTNSWKVIGDEVGEGGGGLWEFDFPVKTADWTAEVGKYYFGDASDTGGFDITMTLPANPSQGDVVFVRDVSTSNAVRIDRNGNPIEQDTPTASNVFLLNNQKHVGLVYIDETFGWTVFDGELEIGGIG